ncbi:SCO2523 family variant P-loop protein [Cryptosporangium minutisporangium]|uniref:SCO2523 family variant P-loop protein n=1 Tax=Cryptosporangium minutisporangium TaxID=113569 RepID=A0ABP6T3U3_9ACTN
MTGCNVALRCALGGDDVSYVDFDFGSPTSGAIFGINEAARGVTGGLHSYLVDQVAEPARLDVWSRSDRDEVRDRPRGAGQLVLFPGDVGGGEFPRTDAVVERCVNLFLRLDEEFDLSVVDLSAGRSYAVEIVLAALRAPALASVPWRWLIFHRWTRQHIIAAAGFLYGHRGLLDNAEAWGHDHHRLQNNVRFVRTAVVDPDSEQLAGLRPAQIAWLRTTNRELAELAVRHRLGRSSTLGSVPHEPVLQWREQLLLDDDVWARQVANQATVEAFEDLAKRLTDDASWEGL